VRRLGAGRTRLRRREHTATGLAGLAASMMLFMLTLNMTDMLLSLAAMLLMHLMTFFMHGMMLGLATALEALGLVLGFLSNLRLATSVEVAAKLMVGILRSLKLHLTLHDIPPLGREIDALNVGHMKCAYARASIGGSDKQLNISRPTSLEGRIADVIPVVDLCSSRRRSRKSANRRTINTSSGEGSCSQSSGSRADAKRLGRTSPSSRHHHNNGEDLALGRKRDVCSTTGLRYNGRLSHNRVAEVLRTSRATKSGKVTRSVASRTLPARRGPVKAVAG